MTECRKSKLLIVDDEKSLLDALRRSFRKLRPEWVIHLAESVEQAEEVVAREDIDVIVSDIYMPGKDGFDLLRFLEQSGRLASIPVVMMTGMNDAELKRRVLEAGATDLLSKPVQTEDMLARVGNCLRLRRYSDKLQEQTEVLRKQVRCLERVATVGTLATGCIHDLKNIVGVIPALLEAIESEGIQIKDESDITLEDVRKCADQAYALTKQILNVIRGDSVLRGECSVIATADDCIAVLKHAIDPRIELKLDIESDIPKLKASPTDIMQILLNICVNAAEAIESHGEVGIHMRYDTAGSFVAGVMGSEVLTLSVKDSGVGIPESEISKIFQPAFSTKRRGTGMGLAVVKNLVEKYNGKIDVSSEVGNGTRFQILLPLQPIDEA